MNNEQTVETPSTSTPPTGTSPVNPKGKSKLLIMAAVGILVLAAMAGGIVWAMQQNAKLAQANREMANLRNNNSVAREEVQAVKAELEKRKQTTGEENIDKNAYQSVFLKSGQVYFGKITSISETQLVLEDIYYLRTNGNGAPFPSDAADVSLVKLGNELHGPQDKMFIERKEIEFWENLKNDSQVAKAIADFKAANP